MTKHAWSRGELVPELRAGRKSKCSRCGLRRRLVDRGAAASPRYVIEYGRRTNGTTVEPPCARADGREEE